jgi:hypothetical protein
MICHFLEIRPKDCPPKVSQSYCQVSTENVADAPPSGYTVLYGAQAAGDVQNGEVPLSAKAAHMTISLIDLYASSLWHSALLQNHTMLKIRETSFIVSWLVGKWFHLSCLGQLFLVGVLFPCPRDPSDCGLLSTGLES